MPGQKPIVVVGSLNIDLVALTQEIPTAGETVIGSAFQIHPGGKGANQAFAIARLGYPVRLIGKLGSDAFASQLRQHLESGGVDMSGVATSEGASGVAVIVVSEKGENIIVVTPGANSTVSPQYLDENLDAIRGAGIVLAQLEIPLDSVSHLARLCKREGVPLMLDPAPALRLPPEIFARIQWITPNETEAAVYTETKIPNFSRDSPEQQAQQILARGVRGVVLKAGARGVYVASHGSQGEQIPAFSVEPVDTTAAGDAFNGGFATALMLGKGPVQSARFACAVAALSVTRMGAQSSMATMNEVNDFLQKNNYGDLIHRRELPSQEIL